MWWNGQSGTQYITIVPLYIAICRAYLFNPSGKPSWVITTYYISSIPIGTILQTAHVLSRTALYTQTSRQTYVMTRHER